MPFRKLSMLEIEGKSSLLKAAASLSSLVFVCDNIRSALNVGSIFRTADAFAIQQVVLCGITAQPPHREILKTALGASETIPWTYFSTVTEAASQLREGGYFLAGLEQVTGSQALHDFRFPDQPIALFLGNEVDGLSEECLNLLDAALEIPQMGSKHSLNVAVAAGVAAWEIRRKELGG